MTDVTNAPMADRQFDPRVLGSITTGVLLIEDFQQVHAATEHIAGYPVWTHEIPKVCKEVCAPAILAVYPEMPVQKPDDWEACADGLLERYGASIAVPAGAGARSEDPVSTLAAAMSAGGANG